MSGIRNTPTTSTVNNLNTSHAVVSMHHYLEACKQLISLLNQLGSTLTPAVKNLEESLAVMDFHVSSNKGIHYEIIERMIKYEVKCKIVRKKVSITVSACVCCRTRFDSGCPTAVRIVTS